MKKNNSRFQPFLASFSRRRLLIYACCFLLPWVSKAVGADPEPSYNGRTLSQWLAAMYPGQAIGGPYLPEIAILGMGTNAIPKLLEWSSYQRLPPKQGNLAKTPEALANATPPPALSAEELAERSVVAFRFLGAVARPAIPELTRLARTSSDQERADRCASSLAAIGPEAIPHLLSLVTNGPPMTRWYAMAALEFFYKNPAAAPAVPVLIECLGDRNDEIGNKAANTLSELGMPDVVVPALTNAMQSSSARSRVWAVRCLGWHHDQVHDVVPVLRAALRDRDREVRVSATNILRRWAPEVLTNAPPPPQARKKGR